MAAAVHAGADAVYMGGSRFGARAYADNPQEDDFLRAMDYAHIHGSRIYMTVNTLVKEREFGELAGFLEPYYLQGLDGVIVQDLGVFALIRDNFPDLPIHVSTQMTVTGPGFARMLKDMGASRVVTARELSLEEIRRIRQETGLEIECFVHGALCYCYSGQCLMSSLIGGRSGNRGRCAQPCRLPYTVGTGDKKEKYLMNLKDLCTLEILPDILDAGVYSLKIEGRMKSPRYTAGVVRIYRKYVDQYLEKGKKGYQVAPEDKRQLLELFDRGGFTQGYYQQHNGRNMIALGEKPGFREKDQVLFDFLDQEYVKKRKQEPVLGRLKVRQGEALLLEIRLAGELGEERESGEAQELGGVRELGEAQELGGVRELGEARKFGKAQELGKAWELGELEKAGRSDGKVCVIGNVVQKAKNQPVVRERLIRQLQKTGESSFYFQELEVDLSGECFVPVQELNDLRRRGLNLLEQKLLEQYRRSRGREGKDWQELQEEARRKPDAGVQRNQQCSVFTGLTDFTGQKPCIHVALEEKNLFLTVLAHLEVKEIDLDCVGFPAEDWREAAEACHKAGKHCGLILPHIFRQKAEQYFTDHKEELAGAGFDELMVRSLEEISFLREHRLEIPVVMDANVYGMNRRACEMLFDMGASRLTLPLELKEKELLELSLPGQELIVYGHLPSMVSAQCVQQTVKGCTGEPKTVYMKDRTGKNFPVKNHCRFCYNTIYNPDPLSLLGLESQVERLSPAVLRLNFTVETKEEARAVLEGFGESFLRGRKGSVPFSAFTRGHFKRGVE